MRKLITTLIFLFVLIVVSLLIWWSLPVSINRYSDIEHGNKIIKRIEEYRKSHELPSDTAWTILKKLGFEDHLDYLVPEYQKLDDENYEVRFVEGFDGPYLLWNTKERKWKMDNPNFPAAWMKK